VFKKIVLFGFILVLGFLAFACQSPVEKLSGFIESKWKPAKDSLFSVYKYGASRNNYINASAKEMQGSGIYTRYFTQELKSEFDSLVQKQEKEKQLQAAMQEKLTLYVKAVESQDLALDKAMASVQNKEKLDLDILLADANKMADSCLVLNSKYKIAFTQSQSAAHNNDQYFKDRLRTEISLFNKAYVQKQK